MSATDERTQLRRLRWLVVTGLALGIAGTTAANVLHAQPSLPARIISAWAPLTLLLVLEVIARAPTPRQWWVRIVVWLMVAVLGSGAAFVSYRHMVAVALRYGEDEIAAHLLPVLVDGLVVVMSAFLVDLSARIRGLEAATSATLPAAAPAAWQAARNLPAPPDNLPGVAPTDQLRALAVVADDAPNEPTAAPDDDANVPDPDPLLRVARELTSGLGAVPGRPALLQELRTRGHKCGTDRAEKLLEKLRAERGQAAA